MTKTARADVVDVASTDTKMSLGAKKLHICQLFLLQTAHFPDPNRRSFANSYFGCGCFAPNCAFFDTIGRSACRCSPQRQQTPVSIEWMGDRKGEEWGVVDKAKCEPCKEKTKEWNHGGGFEVRKGTSTDNL